jgi:3-deoxy-D-manno-octulosonic-acid transferase
VAAASWEPYIERAAKGLVAGNPRVDRALARVENALAEKKAAGRIARWRRRGLCLVAGSTWEADEAVILAAWAGVKGEKSLVLVPHEPDPAHVEKLELAVKAAGFSSARFSKLGDGSDANEADVLVVDERGFLAELYGVGNLSYVGGGFNREVHSIIEPLAHGLPVAFGPNFKRSPEAVTLKATGTAFTLPAKNGAPLLRDWLETMARDEAARSRACESLRVYLKIHRGAGDRIAEFLMHFLGDAPSLPDRALASSPLAGILPPR